MPTFLRDRAPRIEHFEEGDGWVFEGVRRPPPLRAQRLRRPRAGTTAGLGALRGHPARWLGPGGPHQGDRPGRGGRGGPLPEPAAVHGHLLHHGSGLHMAIVQGLQRLAGRVRGARPHPIPGSAHPSQPRAANRHWTRSTGSAAGPSTGGFLIGAFPGGTLMPQAEDDAVFAAPGRAGSGPARTRGAERGCAGSRCGQQLAAGRDGQPPLRRRRRAAHCR